MPGPLLRFLTDLPDELFGLTLLLCRVGMAIMLLPGLGETEAPQMVRIGLMAGLTLLLYPALAPALPGQGSAAQDVAMIAGELLAGGVLGWIARLTALALPAAGQFISFQLGLSSVLQPDPELGAQSAVIAQLFTRALPPLVLATGLYRLPLAALAGSYDIWPAGHALPAAGSAQLAVAAITGFWALAVQLAAPFLFAGLLFSAGIGLIARLVPRTQIFAVTAPAQIVGGLAMLALLMTMLLQFWGERMDQLWSGLPGH